MAGPGGEKAAAIQPLGGLAIAALTASTRHTGNESQCWGDTGERLKGGLVVVGEGGGGGGAVTKNDDL